MKLTQLLQRRLDHKQEARAPTYEKVSDIVNMLRDVAAEKNSKLGAGKTNSVKTPPCISLDMFIAFREEFSGGWNLWLGEEEVTTLTPELKQELPAMTFDEKAEMFFRLSVWSNKTRNSNAGDIAQIPDGIEVFVERVTGLSLYDNKLAQGNTSRIQMVTKVDDPEPEIESPALNTPGRGSEIADKCPSKLGDLDCEEHVDAGSISSNQQKRAREIDLPPTTDITEACEEQLPSEKTATPKNVCEEEDLPSKKTATAKIVRGGLHKKATAVKKVKLE